MKIKSVVFKMLWELIILLTSVILCVFYEYIKNKNKKIASFILFILIIFLSIIFAFREFILDNNLLGTDYYEYKNWFEIKNFSNLFNNINNFGFNLLISIVKVFTSSFYFFLFICALIINTNIIKFTKENSINFTISILIYICLYYTNTFNITRQWIACSIFLYAFKYIKQKNFLKYMFFILLASSFHNTAFFLIIIYPILNSDKFKVKGNIYTIIISGIILFFLSSRFIESLYKLSNLLGFNYAIKYENYTGNVGNYTSFIISLFTFIILIIGNKEIKKKNYDDRMLKISAIYLILFVVMSLLSTKSYIFNRINLYFIGSLMLTFPYLINIFENRSKILVEYIIFIVLSFAFIT